MERLPSLEDRVVQSSSRQAACRTRGAKARREGKLDQTSGRCRHYACGHLLGSACRGVRRDRGQDEDDSEEQKGSDTTRMAPSRSHCPTPDRCPVRPEHLPLSEKAVHSLFDTCSEPFNANVGVQRADQHAPLRHTAHRARRLGPAPQGSSQADQPGPRHSRLLDS
ncbi:hypothetical protein L7F22_068372 [Adiantum nelumboides]|nr:hypothetical protein [Adiantum nelumboides]